MSAAAPATSSVAATGRSGSPQGLSGIAAMVALALRRDRLRWPAWIVPLVVYTAATAAAYESLYPTLAERRTVMTSMGGNPSLRAMYGTPFDLSSAGGFTSWRIGAMTAVVVALMSLLSVVRHTREEEESGRAELVRSAVVGRHTALTAAVGTTVAANFVLAVLVAAGMTAAGTPAVGSAALGASFAGVGLVFTGVGAVAAQVTESARAARGIALVVLGGAFLLRAVGDSVAGASWLTWLSPIGWAHDVRPYAGERWAVLALPVAAVVVLLLVAHRLEARRDLASGILAPRLGPASGSLASPAALSWRLQRAGLVAWGVGMTVFAVALGSIADGVRSLFEDNPTLSDMLRQLGGDRLVVDAYLAAALPLLAVIAATHTLQAVLRLRTEESELRTEQVLAGAVTRRRYAWSHLAIAVVSPVVLMLLIGLGAGVSYAVVAGDGGQVWRVAGAALVSVPAMWVLTGAAMALVGWLPRHAAMVWAVFGVCVLLGQVGRLMRLPDLLLQVSPFAHVPAQPGGTLDWTPLVVLTLVAAALVGVGVEGFRRRDIG